MEEKRFKGYTVSLALENSHSLAIFKLQIRLFKYATNFEKGVNEMTLHTSEIISSLNGEANEYCTSISKDDRNNNITILGNSILNVDFTKYVLAEKLKKEKMFGYTIHHKSLNKILKDPIIRRHYQAKKAEKHHH